MSTSSSPRKFERVRATVDIEFIVELDADEESLPWVIEDILYIAYNAEQNIVKSDATFVYVEGLNETEAVAACHSDFQDAAVQIQVALDAYGSRNRRNAR